MWASDVEIIHTRHGSLTRMHVQATCYNVDTASFNVAIESFVRVENPGLAGMPAIAKRTPVSLG